MTRWFFHLMGWDTAPSDPYSFWSGSGGLIVAWAATVLLLWWRRSCRRSWWCPLIGDHAFTDPADGTTRRLCWVHHPDVKGKYLTAERLRAIQERRHLYLGKRPGRG